MLCTWREVLTIRVKLCCRALLPVDEGGRAKGATALGACRLRCDCQCVCQCVCLSGCSRGRGLGVSVIETES